MMQSSCHSEPVFTIHFLQIVAESKTSHCPTHLERVADGKEGHAPHCVKSSLLWQSNLVELSGLPHN